jgi:hypothetical protein
MGMACITGKENPDEQGKGKEQWEESDPNLLFYFASVYISDKGVYVVDCIKADCNRAVRELVLAQLTADSG